MQARLDLQSGILHAEDKDYTTAYSYFYETFESLSAQDDPGALGALKYMLLCKIMLNLVRTAEHQPSTRNAHRTLQPEDVTALLSVKFAAKYAQLRDVESMRAVARAHQQRNLADFEKALKDYQQGTFPSYPPSVPLTHEYRALERPNNPDAPQRAVRQAARAEPVADRRAVQRRRG